jgi:hypothetical protein
MPVLYPEGLTDAIQIAIGCFVLAVNVAVYSVVIARWRRRNQPEASALIPSP